MRVTWAPTWEPELKESWPAFLQCIGDYEAYHHKPDLTKPTADIALDDLERQGFRKADDKSTWNQKLDTELRNKVTFDLCPTYPRVDIIPTGCCEFWLKEIGKVRVT